MPPEEDAGVPDWHRAYGQPVFSATLRSRPEDFEVTERLGWEMSGDGEHDFLWVEKTGANTEWVAKQIARHAEVPNKEVGYAGLKDRHAKTRQWFSVPRWHSPEWDQFEAEGVRIIEVERHRRKLRRGAHDGNAFRILLRDPAGLDREAVEHRLALIARNGVPNYYGEQRFGRGGGNLQLADDWAAGKRMPRPKKSLAISTVRSFAFNQTLSQRVARGTWNQMVTGEKANLDGSSSVFAVDVVDETLRQRCEQMDVHPALVLAGDGTEVQPAHWQSALNKARVAPDFRSARLRVRDLEAEFIHEGLVLHFVLGRGAYATVVLRELCRW